MREGRWRPLRRMNFDWVQWKIPFCILSLCSSSSDLSASLERTLLVANFCLRRVWLSPAGVHFRWPRCRVQCSPQIHFPSCFSVTPWQFWLCHRSLSYRRDSFSSCAIFLVCSVSGIRARSARQSALSCLQPPPCFYCCSICAPVLVILDPRLILSARSSSASISWPISWFQLGQLSR
jgi:hypothetical protein